jgi:hypothetical protein
LQDDEEDLDKDKTKDNLDNHDQHIQEPNSHGNHHNHHEQQIEEPNSPKTDMEAILLDIDTESVSLDVEESLTPSQDARTFLRPETIL